MGPPFADLGFFSLTNTPGETAEGGRGRSPFRRQPRAPVSTSTSTENPGRSAALS